MAIRSEWTLIIEPTNAQVAAEEYERRTGEPCPGMSLSILGYQWCLRDVVRMRDSARGQELTVEEAEAAAAKALEALVDADSHRIWMEETSHRRAGATSMEDLIERDREADQLETDRDLAAVRAGVYDQDRDNRDEEPAR